MQVAPSSVISRFLASQRVSDLSTYLRALHTAPAATPAAEHTTLFLQCLCTLRDSDGLEQYVQWASAPDTPPVAVHASAAIGVLRVSGHAPLAVRIAEGVGAVEELLELLLGDGMREYDRALEVMRQQPAARARRALLTAGRILLRHRPKQTTALLCELCVPLTTASSHAAQPGGAPSTPCAASHAVGPIGGARGGGSAGASAIVAHGRDAQGGDLTASSAAAAASVESFLPLFSDYQRSLLTFLEALIGAGPQPSVIADTLLALYIAPRSPRDGAGREEVDISMAATTPTIAASAATAASTATPKESAADAGILLATRRAKAAALLRRPAVTYDAGQALLLCLQYQWTEGLVFLYEKAGRYRELLRLYEAACDDDAILRTCRRFAETEPRVWLHALRYFIGRAASEPEAGPVSGAAPSAGDRDRKRGLWRTHISEVIAAIEDDELLPTIELVQALSAAEGGGLGNGIGSGVGSGEGGGEGGRAARIGHCGVPLGVAREVIERQLRVTEAAEADQLREARRSADENARMRAEIGEIAKGSRVFQLSKCSACHGQLEAPTVHFLCMHSYHQACLGDHDGVCLVCAPQCRRQTEQQQQQRTLARGHAEYFKQVEGSADGFGTAAEFLGRGMLCPLNDGCVRYARDE